MSVVHFGPPTIPLDANGLPDRHKEASFRAAQELADYINDFPDGFYRMTSADCQSAAENIIQRYLHVVKGLQR